jgi:hypothetical protein
MDARPALISRVLVRLLGYGVGVLVVWVLAAHSLAYLNDVIDTPVTEHAAVVIVEPLAEPDADASATTAVKTARESSVVDEIALAPGEAAPALPEPVMIASAAGDDDGLSAVVARAVEPVGRTMADETVPLPRMRPRFVEAPLPRPRPVFSAYRGLR